MSEIFRRRSKFGLPITLSVVLITLNVALMVCWIVLLAPVKWWSAMTIGIVVFSVMLVGLSLYLALMIKEIRLNRRQANFIDSVTHELKSPIASLQLYLETLEMRQLTDDQRTSFYRTMEDELTRLDHLITQLLEVGRLDAIGNQVEAQDVVMESLLRQCGKSASAHHKQVEEEVISYDIEPSVVHARPLVMETIFRNLLDNALKYSGPNPQIGVQVRVTNAGRVITQIIDNGEGVPHRLRKKVFRMFFRGGNELERKQKGTGLGLYIVYTLVRQLNGSITIRDREEHSGSIFEVDLPGKALSCTS